MFTMYNTISDNSFLKKLDAELNKVYFIEILVLDDKEKPFEHLEGQISLGGNINIDGKSSLRRTSSLTFVCSDRKRTIEDVNYLLSVNRRLKITIGVKNDIDPAYDDIIGFPQGIFVITQINCNHSPGGITVAMTIKDKMCLLNGECGGTLPASTIFDSYDQYYMTRELDKESDLPDPRYDEVNEYTIYKIQQDKGFIYRIFNPTSFSAFPNDSSKWYNPIREEDLKKYTYVTIKNPIYDIIQTLVCNFGNESLDKIFINDVDLVTKQLSRWTNTGHKLYYNSELNKYTIEQPSDYEGWRVFDYNENIGYKLIPFVFPGELVAGIGDTVTSVLDKIIQVLGNYEYFYDINGNFIFQEKRNYLNNSYIPLDTNVLNVIAGEIIQVDDITTFNNFTEFLEGYVNAGNKTFYISESEDISISVEDKTLNINLTVSANNASILNLNNYKVDFAGSEKSEYTFLGDRDLVTTYTNAPIYTNIKNDFHIWGKGNEGVPIHFHFAIKDKPAYMNTYYVEFYDDDYHQEGQLYLSHNNNPTWKLIDDNTVTISQFEYENLSERDKLRYEKANEVCKYIPSDWRAELYLQGLEEQRLGQRPDIFKQELLNNFDNIYNFKEKKFRTDIIKTPNNMIYWFDYLEPVDGMEDYSVDTVGVKTKTQQSDKIVNLFDMEAPDVFIVSEEGAAADKAKTIARCATTGEKYSEVPKEVYDSIIANIAGYTAQEYGRDLLYQHITSSQTITVAAAPVYYLEPNTRITVRDPAANISGDYVINSISIPLDGKSTMSINAIVATERL